MHQQSPAPQPLMQAVVAVAVATPARPATHRLPAEMVEPAAVAMADHPRGMEQTAAQALESAEQQTPAVVAVAAVTAPAPRSVEASTAVVAAVVPGLLSYVTCFLRLQRPTLQADQTTELRRPTISPQIAP